jgi:hypothetical protein
MPDKTQSKRTKLRLVAAAIAIVVAITGVLLAWLWFGASGAGEFRSSPDGRFTAHAMNMSTGTFSGGRHHYIEVRVVEETSRVEVWRVIRHHAHGVDVPDYGNRGRRFITWAADSSAVTVPVVGGRELVLPVPFGP